MKSVSRSLEWVGAEHRSYSRRMIEGPMLVLADAVEAQGIEGRQGARKYSSFVPLNRLVDAARPDGEPAAVRDRIGPRDSVDRLGRLRALPRPVSGWHVPRLVEKGRVLGDTHGRSRDRENVHMLGPRWITEKGVARGDDDGVGLEHGRHASSPAGGRTQSGEYAVGRRAHPRG